MVDSAIVWIDDLFHLFGSSPPKNFTLYVSLLVILIPVPICFFFLHSSRPRQAYIPPYRERVLILGASSGVGEELAYQYATRGCRHLILVARRGDELERVKTQCFEKRRLGEEWEQSQEAPGWEGVDKETTVSTIQADCTNAQDLLKIRQGVRKTMGGIDTIHIVFGASALKSLLGVAGVDPLGKEGVNASNAHATIEGIQATMDATRKIMDINVAATAAVLATFVPLLQLSSPSPSLILLSSIAALVPPPTRSLYSASKAAQLQIFQSVAIESSAQVKADTTGKRKDIRFFALAPSTIKTDFRKSAVDGPIDPTIKDSSWDASKSSSSDILTVEEVAYQAIRGSDRMVEGLHCMPLKFRWIRLIYALVPGRVDAMAKKKYGYGG